MLLYLSSTRWNLKISCLGYLVAMVTKDCLKISQHFIFASISVAIATTIISITLYLVPQVVNRHFCFRNQHQMCAYFIGFHGNISLYIMTMKCIL